MRISDWSSDVCSSDLSAKAGGHIRRGQEAACRSHGGRPASCLSARTGIGGRRKSGTVRVSVARHFRILRASGAPARGPYPVLAPEPVDGAAMKPFSSWRRQPSVDRQSVVKGKSVSVRVDLGGRRMLKKTTHKQPK